MKKVIPSLGVLLVLAVPAACGSKEPAVPTSVDAGFAYGGEPDASPIAPVGPEDAGAPVQDAGGDLATVALDGALDLAVSTLAAKDAPGMAPEGPAGRETLAEGAHFNMLVTLQPGRCYTVIATSPAMQVAELEVKLLAPPMFTIEAGRSAAADKNPAVLGRGKAATCPILPIALPYKVDVIAKKGAGRILVQVFSKAK